MGPGWCIISGVTMAEHAYACSSFTIKNNNGSEVCSLLNSLGGISEYYSMSRSLYYLCIHLAQAQVEVPFKLKRSTGNTLSTVKVEKFVKLNVYDVERVDYTDWKELEYWMHLLNN